MASILNTIWIETYELWDAVLGGVGGIFTKKSEHRHQRNDGARQKTRHHDHHEHHGHLHHAAHHYPSQQLEGSHRDDRALVRDLQDRASHERPARSSHEQPHRTSHEQEHGRRAIMDRQHDHGHDAGDGDKREDDSMYAHANNHNRNSGERQRDSR